MSWPRLVRLTALLLFVDLLDELAGVGSVASPDIQQDLGLSYAAITGVLFTLPQVVALLAEPPLLLLAAHQPWARKLLTTGGLAVMGAGLLLAAGASSGLLLAGALCVVFIGSGVGVNLAQATLMDAAPDRRDALMTRWALLGEVGDLGTPLLLAALGALALGWRAAFVTVGVAILLHAGWLALRRFPAASGDEDDDEDESPSVRDLLGAALGNRSLLIWLLVAAVCTLLDEIFVAFAALYLEHHLHASVGARAAGLAVCMVGGIGGLAASEALLHRGVAARTLMIGASAVCGAGLTALLLAPDPWTAGAALALVGVGATPLWPLAKARAFASHPDHSAMVESLSSAMGGLELLLPLGLGLVADRAGLLFAMTLMGVQPLVVVLAALFLRSRPDLPETSAAPPV